MRAIIGFFKKKWVVQLIGIVALGALIWFAGPLIAIAGRVPLAGELARGLAIAGVVVVFIIWRLIATIRAGRKDRQLMAELTAPASTKTPEQEATEEHLQVLRRTFEEALKVLQETRAARKGNRHYLYELPWYVIIGPPGSGKTTALVNSGLKFPLANRLGNNPIRGVSGTRNCEWLFAEEAVLLDTAGRYVTQESYQAVDAAEWRGFLDLLKKYRPRRPINGILVSLSVADLLQQTEEERALHARAIRQRVQELYQVLGVRFPIYMLFTKSDLVAGFTDFFADLGEEERAQVFGETFPAETVAESRDLIERFAGAYQELLDRLNRRTYQRIQEERDLQRRSAILDYPQQMALLKPAMLTFLRDAFGPSRYEAVPLLRGIYFTSGTQEGTPIDRVMGLLAQAFRLDRQAAPVYSGRGKSFFLTRLLRDVIFPEAELAGVDPRVERRQHLLQAGAYASALVVTLGVIALWAVSYGRNQEAIGRVEEAIARYRTAEAASGTDARALLPKLEALRAVDEVYAEAGWASHWGLSQGEKLRQAAGHAYEHWLKSFFLPAVTARVAQRMVTGSEAGNPDILYELLRVYLMLGRPERMDARIVRPWIKVDWERQFSAEPEIQAKLLAHLDRLLAFKLEPLPLDDRLIAAVRTKLTQVPQGMQIYARFKNEALLDSSRDFRLADVLGPPGERAFVAADGRDIKRLTVPGLFTAYGYAELFLKRSLDFVKTAVEQNWVLGQERATEPAEIERLHSDFRKLYLADYQKAWSGLLANLRLRQAAGLNQTVDLLDVLSRPDSPLRSLLESVEKNTSLTKVSTLAAELMGKAGGAVEKPDERTQKLLEAAKQAGLEPETQERDPARAVENAFESLNELVRGSADRPPPLNATLQTLAALRDYVMQIGGAASRGEQALKTAAGRIAGGGGDVIRQAQLEFSRLPEPLKTWLMSLTKFGWSQTLAGAKGELDAMLKTGVASPCQTAFAGRYPFVRGSPRDATLADFAKFFAPNGVLDQFFQTNLKNFVDTHRPVWTQVSLDNQSLGLSPAAIRQFQNAARIRDAFFAAGGPAFSVAFELKPLSLDERLAAFRLALEGQETAYRHGPEQIARFQWPGPTPSSGVRLVFETLDGRQVSRGKEGPWAWFRVLDESQVEKTGQPDRFYVTFQAEGFKARYELRAASVNNPFNLAELKSFSCPEAL